MHGLFFGRTFYIISSSSWRTCLFPDSWFRHPFLSLPFVPFHSLFYRRVPPGLAFLAPAPGAPFQRAPVFAGSVPTCSFPCSSALFSISGIEGEECDEGGRKKWEEIGQEKQHGKFLFSVNVTYCYFPKCSYWSQIFSGRSTCGALGRPTSPPRLADQSGSRWDGGSRACAPEWLMDRRPLLGCWEVWLY